MTVSHLPFLFLEHQEFYDLISYARLAPTTPTIPSRKVIRTRFREFVTENQTTALRSLPPDAKLSLAFDCWTSPFQQAFMAITAYFLDQNWDYREVILVLNHFPVHIQGPTLVRLSYGLYDSIKSSIECLRLRQTMRLIILRL